MEQMATCLEKLLKKLREPIPEQIIGKMVVAVSLTFVIMNCDCTKAMGRGLGFIPIKDTGHYW